MKWLRRIELADQPFMTREETSKYTDPLPDGTARNMRVLYNFYPGRSADGMSVDIAGNLYAAAGMHQTRNTSETLDTKCGVYVISPQGKLLKFIPIPEDYITNTAFGGPDMKTLYLADNNPKGDRLLLAFPLKGDGSVGQRKTLHNFAPDRWRRPRAPTAACRPPWRPGRRR